MLTVKTFKDRKGDSEFNSMFAFSTLALSFRYTL